MKIEKLKLTRIQLKAKNEKLMEKLETLKSKKIQELEDEIECNKTAIETIEEKLKSLNVDIKELDLEDLE